MLMLPTNNDNLVFLYPSFSFLFSHIIVLTRTSRITSNKNGILALGLFMIFFLWLKKFVINFYYELVLDLIIMIHGIK